MAGPSCRPSPQIHGDMCHKVKVHKTDDGKLHADAHPRHGVKEIQYKLELNTILSLETAPQVQLFTYSTSLCTFIDLEFLQCVNELKLM